MKKTAVSGTQTERSVTRAPEKEIYRGQFAAAFEQSFFYGENICFTKMKKKSADK